MRVTVKIVLAMILILLGSRTVEGWLTVERETERLQADIERDAALMRRMLGVLIDEVWAARGRDEALALLGRINVEDHPVTISWVPAEGEDGLAAQLDAEAMDRLAQGGSVAVDETNARRDADARYHVYIPIDAAEEAGAIRVTESLAQRSRYIDRAMTRELLAGGVVVLLGGAGMILSGLWVIGRPLTRLRQRIDRIGQGNLEERIQVRSRDELAALARGLNRMCEQLSASHAREREATEKRIAALEQMRHTDRLTTIGRLASGIAHELGTPLNVVTGRAAMISDDDLPPDRMREYAGTIREQGDRMTEIIKHLLNFARQRQPERRPTRVSEVVEQTAGLVASLGYKGRVRIDDADRDTELEAMMDRGQIQQVLINLIENALQAMPEGGEVVISTACVHAEPPAGTTATTGQFIRIDVRDTGVGVAPEHIAELFDPFFTTKQVGQGTGLGLSIVHGIVHEHGGWIDVSSEVGEGSCFSVYLPYDQVT